MGKKQLNVEFTKKKIETLNKFIIVQKTSIENNQDLFHSSYKKGFEYFFGDGRFEYHDFINKLAKLGWSIQPVDGYLSGYEYLKNLNNQVLPFI